MRVKLSGQLMGSNCTRRLSHSHITHPSPTHRVVPSHLALVYPSAGHIELRGEESLLTLVVIVSSEQHVTPEQVLNKLLPSAKVSKQ